MMRGAVFTTTPPPGDYILRPAGLWHVDAWEHEGGSFRLIKRFRSSPEPSVMP